MNQNQLLKLGKEILKQENIEDAEAKSRRLIEFVLNQTREECIRNSLNDVSALKEQEYKKLLEEIIHGKPLQYITNNQEFMGLNFYVDENVLIPQPDTEILVEQALMIINKVNEEERKLENISVLDLCTGSGAIAVSIAKHVYESKSKENIQSSNFKIAATDISDKALEVAKKNTIQNEVADKIKLIQSDMFSKLTNYKFDIIVSNPPYIETSIISTLSEEVKEEPTIALDGGEDGLDFYRIILEQADKYLKPNGYVLFEIGYDQGIKILSLWEKLKAEGKCNLELISKEPIKDLAGNDRVMILKGR